MKKTLWFLTFLSLSFLFSCSSTKEKQQEERYGFSKINCYVRYMAQRRELQAEMTFRTDSTIQIEGDVLLNDEPMQFKKLPVVGLQYRLLKDRVNFQNAYNFIYTEKDGSEQSIDITMGKFQSLRVASKDGISQKLGGVLTWDGDPLEKEDGLVMIFTDAEGTTFQINHAGITKGNKFEILPVHSQRLAKGKASLMVTRRRTVVEKSEQQTRLASIEYYLPAIEFEVVD